MGKEVELGKGLVQRIDSMRWVVANRDAMKGQRDQYRKIANDLCTSIYQCHQCPYDTRRCDMRCEISRLNDTTGFEVTDGYSKMYGTRSE